MTDDYEPDYPDDYDDSDIVHCTLCGCPMDVCVDCILVEAPLPAGRHFNDPDFTGCGQLKLCPTCAAACTKAIDQHYHDQGICEHGVNEGDWCAECNAEYKMARVQNDGVCVATGRQPCTCTGTCRGAEGLGLGWFCVLQPTEVKLNQEPRA